MRTRLKLEPKVTPMLKQKISLVYVGAGFALVSVTAIILFFYLNIGNQDDTYAQNQSYSTRASGNWTSAATWSGSNIPPVDGLNKDVVNINNNITYTGNITIDNQATIIINEGASLVLAGDFIVNNELTLLVNGSLIISGSLSANNGASITVNGGGTIGINENATFENNTEFLVDGNVDIGGILSFGTNTTFGGTGFVTTGGSGCSGWNGTTGNCSENMTLPVELLAFTANADDSRVVITWQTATELNNDYFNIERSANGIEFESIAEIKGNGTTKEISDYEYTDSDPLAGLSYYRLVQTDFDGTSETFKPISVTVEPTSDNNVEIFPNPLTGSVLQLRIDQPEEGSLEIFDQGGYKIFSQQLDGFNREEEFNLPGTLVKGIYFVHVNTGSFKKTFKLVKR